MKEPLVDNVLLVGLAALWGTSYLLIKLSIAEVPPVTLSAMRLTIGACALIAWCRIGKIALPRSCRYWKFAGLAALLGNVAPFTLIGWAEISIDSSTAAMLLTFAPLSAMLLAHFLTTDERLSSSQIIAAAIGTVGLVVLISPSALWNFSGTTLAQLAVVAAGFCYGLNAIVTKLFQGLRAESAAAAVLICSVVMALPASLVFDRPWTLQPSLIPVVSAVALGLFQTGLATLVLVLIIRRRGAIFFAQVNYLVPVFGTVAGVMVLGETLPPSAIAGTLTILVSLAIAQSNFPILNYFSHRRARLDGSESSRPAAFE